MIAKNPKDPDEILKFALLEEKSWEAVRVEPVSNALLTLPSTSTYEQAGTRVVFAASHRDEREKNDIEQLRE